MFSCLCVWCLSSNVLGLKVSVGDLVILLHGFVCGGDVSVIQLNGNMGNAVRQKGLDVVHGQLRSRVSFSGGLSGNASDSYHGLRRLSDAVQVLENTGACHLRAHLCVIRNDHLSVLSDP